MLTRLKVSGFKNLVDVDVRFGPFTCVAGPNGVGKSNLFDAIRFLSALADRSLMEAAQVIRDEEGRTSDIRNLFHRVGDQYASEMSFEVEMIVPPSGLDDLGQFAEATTTFLRYSLVLGYRFYEGNSGSLELLKEELGYVSNRKGAKEHLLFEHSLDWRNSVLQGVGRKGNRSFISTTTDDNSRKIYQHQDGGGSGRPYPRLAEKLPRTVLSSVNASESPTALLAKREMQSWHLLQLEPSSLRKPDEMNASSHINMDGAHLPATLFRLSKYNESRVFQEVTNNLAALLDDIYSVNIDLDEKREILTLIVEGKDGTWHPAKSLSDGTLRFLALTVMSLDPETTGLICLEEPENGIHPRRIPSMLDLLRKIATDPEERVDEDNPLRQVIINTHSPAVVLQVPEDSLLVAELVEKFSEQEGLFKSVQFNCLPNTWREKTPEGVNTTSLGDILAYLNPVPLINIQELAMNDNHFKTRRVIDREDVQQLLLPLEFDRE